MLHFGNNILADTPTTKGVTEQTPGDVCPFTRTKSAMKICPISHVSTPQIKLLTLKICFLPVFQLVWVQRGQGCGARSIFWQDVSHLNIGVMKIHHMTVVMEYTPLIQQFVRT